MTEKQVLWLRMQRPQIPAEDLRAAVKAFPDVEVLETSDDGQAQHALPRITAVFSDMPVPEALVAEMPALRWVHTTRGGAFPYLVPSIRKRNISVTTSTGAHGDSYGDFALAWILAWANRLPLFWRAQQERTWDTSHKPELVEGKTVLVVGLGNAGTAVATRAHGLGIRVMATKRTVDTRPDYIERLETPDRLQELLPLADFVAITVASVESTVNIIGEAELRKLRNSAFLIGMTQARWVDLGLLSRALREGWLAGAVLNTVPQEPLPPDSELWEVPNLFIVPHTAGAVRDAATVLRIFVENLRAFVSDGSLKNVVNHDLGY